jgi:hypothetical protein
MALAEEVDILPAQGWPAFPAAGAALLAFFGICHVSGGMRQGVFWAQCDPRRGAFGSIVRLSAGDKFRDTVPYNLINNFSMDFICLF